MALGAKIIGVAQPPTGFDPRTPCGCGMGAEPEAWWQKPIHDRPWYEVMAPTIAPPPATPTDMFIPQAEPAPAEPPSTKWLWVAVVGGIAATVAWNVWAEKATRKR